MIPQYWLVLRPDGVPDAYLIARSLPDALAKIPYNYTARPIKVSDNITDLPKVSPAKYRSGSKPNAPICVYLSEENYAWYQKQQNKSSEINRLITNEIKGTSEHIK